MITCKIPSRLGDHHRRSMGFRWAFGGCCMFMSLCLVPQLHSGGRNCIYFSFRLIALQISCNNLVLSSSWWWKCNASKRSDLIVLIVLWKSSNQAISVNSSNRIIDLVQKVCQLQGPCNCSSIEYAVFPKMMVVIVGIMLYSVSLVIFLSLRSYMVLHLHNIE